MSAAATMTRAEALANVPKAFHRFICGHGKSPWNPSRSATSRVLNPLPAPTTCACGRSVEIAHHLQVYGAEYSDWPWIYRCAHCDASVGMHPFTSIPLGTLADKQLRALRKSCKQPFELLWSNGRMDRKAAYGALARHLRIPVEECHFGWFDADTCKRARDWAVSSLRGEAA